MVVNKISILKTVGHELLDEYIGLLQNPSSNQKTNRTRAYTALSKRLRLRYKQHKFHFASMTERYELQQAIEMLRTMIGELSERRSRLVAPNVRELQRQASELNKNI